MKEIAVLGSTGSIGTQTLDVIRAHSDLFHAQVLCAHKSVEKLLAQAEEFHPSAIVITDEEAGRKFKDLYHGAAEVIIGGQGLTEAAVREDVDLVLVAVVGIAGLAPTLAAIGAEKELALANKETLVAGGSLVLEEAGKHHVLIRPVDSEHSAIFQCLRAAEGNRCAKIFLTASGGPFRTWPKERIENATREEALNHPTWRMGSKITVDSASMFNKALEIIEARWLFDVKPSQIQVLVHPQSIVHSMIAFQDGAVIAQLGVPDMRVPILYAMTFPKRAESGVKTPDFAALGPLTFEQGDSERFPALRLAYEALKAGGATTSILNAANEVAVEAFLDGRIPFGAISRTVESVLTRLGAMPLHALSDVYAADEAARVAARERLQKEMN